MNLHRPQTTNPLIYSSFLCLILKPSGVSMADTKANDMGTSSTNHGDISPFPDAGVAVIPSSWFQTSVSSFSSASEGDNVHDIFKVLSDVQLPTQGNSSMETIMDFLCESEEGGRKRKTDEKDIPKCQSYGIGGVSRELKGKQDVQYKRIRSAEVHNKSERMRRDRIKVKMRALQELIPNCNKSDRASMLDDAIEYLKALKLQVHMMSMGGSALCQVPYMSPTSVQTIQVPNFSTLLQIRPGLAFGMGVGMGMAGLCYNPNFPLMSIPSAGLHPSPSATSGLPVMSSTGDPSAPQFHVPFFPSQQLPTTASMSVMQPIITPAFCHPNQGESASTSTPRITTNLQQVPIIPQASITSESQNLPIFPQ